MSLSRSPSFPVLVLLLVGALVLLPGCMTESPAAEAPISGVTTYEPTVPQYTSADGSDPALHDLAAYVQNASMYTNAVGGHAALAEFQKKNGRFSEGNRYIAAYDYNCTLRADPFETALVATNCRNLTDVRGLPVVRIGAYTASTGGGFTAALYPAPEGSIIDEMALDTMEPMINYVSPAGETWWISSGMYVTDMVPGDSPRPEVISEMIGLVEDAAAYGREKGTAMAFREISNRSGRFVDTKGHYIYAYDYNGTLLADPYLPEKIGTSLMDHRDPFGMESIRALAGTAHAGGGYIVFIWPNPDKSNREELKIGYVLPVDDRWWVGSGVYLGEITGKDSSFPSRVP